MPRPIQATGKERAPAFAITAGLFFDNMLSKVNYIPCADSGSCRMLINKYYSYRFGKRDMAYIDAHMRMKPTETAQKCRDMFNDQSAVRNDRVLLLLVPGGNT